METTCGCRPRKTAPNTRICSTTPYKTLGEKRESGQTFSVRAKNLMKRGGGNAEHNSPIESWYTRGPKVRNKFSSSRMFWIKGFFMVDQTYVLSRSS